MSPGINVDSKAIFEFCQRHHIKRFAFFGSVLRQDFNSDSDVDVLVEFESGHTPGLAFFKMEYELSKILGRKVDLNTLNFISPLIRDKIRNQSHIEYDAA